MRFLFSVILATVASYCVLAQGEVNLESYTRVCPHEVNTEIADVLKFGLYAIFQKAEECVDVNSYDRVSVSKVHGVYTRDEDERLYYIFQVNANNRDDATLNASLTISCTQDYEEKELVAYDYAIRVDRNDSFGFAKATYTESDHEDDQDDNNEDGGYEELDSSEYQSQKVQQLLVYASKYIFDAEKEKIPEDNYHISNINSLEMKTDDDGYEYYKVNIRVENQDENSSIDMKFTLKYNPDHDNNENENTNDDNNEQNDDDNNDDNNEDDGWSWNSNDDNNDDNNNDDNSGQDNNNTSNNDTNQDDGWSWVGRVAQDNPLYEDTNNNDNSDEGNPRYEDNNNNNDNSGDDNNNPLYEDNNDDNSSDNSGNDNDNPLYEDNNNNDNSGEGNNNPLYEDNNNDDNSGDDNNNPLYEDTNNNDNNNENSSESGPLYEDNNGEDSVEAVPLYEDNNDDENDNNSEISYEDNSNEGTVVEEEFIQSHDGEEIKAEVLCYWIEINNVYIEIN